MGQASVAEWEAGREATASTYGPYGFAPPAPRATTRHRDSQLCIHGPRNTPLLHPTATTPHPQLLQHPCTQSHHPHRAHSHRNTLSLHTPRRAVTPAPRCQPHRSTSTQ